LNKRLKKRGIRTDVSRRDDVDTPPNVEVMELWRASDIVGFIFAKGRGCPNDLEVAVLLEWLSQS